MTARQKFKRGDPVKLIPRYKKKYSFNKEGDVLGYVDGFCISPTEIKVRPDGRKSSRNYPMDIWEKVDG